MPSAGHRSTCLSHVNPRQPRYDPVKQTWRRRQRARRFASRLVRGRAEAETQATQRAPLAWSDSGLSCPVASCRSSRWRNSNSRRCDTGHTFPRTCENQPGLWTTIAVGSLQPLPRGGPSLDGAAGWRSRLRRVRPWAWLCPGWTAHLLTPLVPPPENEAGRPTRHPFIHHTRGVFLHPLSPGIYHPVRSRRGPRLGPGQGAPRDGELGCGESPWTGGGAGCVWHGAGRQGSHRVCTNHMGARGPWGRAPCGALSSVCHGVPPSAGCGHVTLILVGVGGRELKTTETRRPTLENLEARSAGAGATRGPRLLRL